MPEITEEERTRLQEEYEKSRRPNPRFFKGRASSDGLEFLDDLVSKLIKWNKDDIKELKSAGDMLVNNGARIILNQVANEQKETKQEQYKDKKEQVSQQQI